MNDENDKTRCERISNSENAILRKPQGLRIGARNTNTTELELLHQFIENFNPEEFSSSSNFVVRSEPDEIIYARAQKIKDRIHRKNQMDDYFRKVLETEITAANNVCISQKEIDALLSGAVQK